MEGMQKALSGVLKHIISENLWLDESLQTSAGQGQRHSFGDVTVTTEDYDSTTNTFDSNAVTPSVTIDRLAEAERERMEAQTNKVERTLKQWTQINEVSSTHY